MVYAPFIAGRMIDELTDETYREERERIGRRKSNLLNSVPTFSSARLSLQHLDLDNIYSLFPNLSDP